MSRWIRVLCTILPLIAGSACHSDPIAPGDGGTSLPPGLTLKLDPFIPSGFASAPVFLAQPLNDTRIFVVEQAGMIRVIRDGTLLATPFLDISTRVLSGGERGLLSVAFHLQYATNHFFYVYFTSQPTGDIRIERFTTTADPEVADPATSTLIITVAHPPSQSNHNGGLVAFGLDGMLYTGLGDGGGGGDPYHTGQDPDSLLGSLLRLDVNHGTPYSIPPGNPYIGLGTNRGEIWAKGLRNPWRFAFDAPTGLLYIADVGQNAHEEVDVAPASAPGVNYGWSVMEGLSCYNALVCTRSGFALPVIDYDTHVNSTCAVTGGYVYRGNAIPAIRGHYFYSDYCAGFLRSFRYANGVAVDRKDWALTMSAVASFGVDINGELYVMSGGSIFKISQGS